MLWIWYSRLIIWGACFTGVSLCEKSKHVFILKIFSLLILTVFWEPNDVVRRNHFCGEFLRAEPGKPALPKFRARWLADAPFLRIFSRLNFPLERSQNCNGEKGRGETRATIRLRSDGRAERSKRNRASRLRAGCAPATADTRSSSRVQRHPLHDRQWRSTGKLRSSTRSV